MALSKKMRTLLDSINDQKQKVVDLANKGKLEEAKAEKEKLKEMQDKFNLLADLEDDDVPDNPDDPDGVKPVNDKDKKPAKKDIVRAYVNRIVCSLTHKRMKQEDKEIMDMMSEGTDEDGGFTVPEDIQTDIRELRRTDDDLEQYVNVEKVTTKSGRRTMEKDADSTPWPDVDEGEEFEVQETPKLVPVKYEIKKKGGILEVTRELLQDTAENILAFLNKWIAKKSRATRNAAILAKLEEITTGKEVAISDYDAIKDVFNEKLDPAIAASSIVLTNQSGFNFLDKIKDQNGNYILQHDVTDKSKMLLFGVYPIKKVSNKVLKNVEVKKGGSDEHKDEIVAYKYPIYMGDLKEAITLFDREKITVELSTEAGDLWAKDKTGIKVRDRFDIQAVDKEAVLKGVITVNVAG